MESILTLKQDGIGRITFNRPEVFNSFNREMALACQEALKDFEEDEQIRVIVVRGEGKAFCAGQDIKEITNPELNPGFKKILDEHYNPIVQLLRSIEKPIIGAINGVAAGAGANIALACDIVVASEKASFIQAFSGIGLIPDSGGTYLLPRIIGFQKALALAMLGDKVSASEAEKMGMVYKSVSAEEFEDTINQLAAKLSKMPTKGLGLTKRAFNEGLTNTLGKQLMVESKLQIEASSTEDYTEGVQAFIEKRKPRFKGR